MFMHTTNSITWWLYNVRPTVRVCVSVSVWNAGDEKNVNGLVVVVIVVAILINYDHTERDATMTQYSVRWIVLYLLHLLYSIVPRRQYLRANWVYGNVDRGGYTQLRAVPNRKKKEEWNNVVASTKSVGNAMPHARMSESLQLCWLLILWMNRQRHTARTMDELRKNSLFPVVLLITTTLLLPLLLLLRRHFDGLLCSIWYI